MKKVHLFIVASLLSFLFFLHLSSSSSLQVSLNLNQTSVEWSGGVNASGRVEDSEGNAWSGNVTVKLAGDTACSTTSDSNGFYNCTFGSPQDIGDYSVKAYAFSDGSVMGSSSSKTLSVVYEYGSDKTVGNVASITLPVLMQHQSGEISVVRVTFKLW